MMKESVRCIIRKQALVFSVVFALVIVQFFAPLTIIHALSNEPSTIENSVVENDSEENLTLEEEKSESDLEEITSQEDDTFDVEYLDDHSLEEVDTASLSSVGQEVIAKQEVVDTVEQQQLQAVGIMPLATTDIAITSEQDIKDAFASANVGDTLNLVLQNDVILASTTPYLLIPGLIGGVPSNLTVILSSQDNNQFVIQTSLVYSGAYTGSTNARHFVVNQNTTLVINNVTIQGSNSDVNANYTNLQIGGGIIVDNGGTLILNAGSIIQNNVGGPDGSQPTRIPGGGVTLNGSSSDRTATNLIINGGIIRQNRVGWTQTSGTGVRNGAGIYSKYSTITMNSGEISNNVIGNDGYSNDGGAGVYLFNSNMVMNSGTITRNTNTFGNGGGLSVFSNSTFTMNGGEISYNSVPNTVNTTGLGGGLIITGGSTFNFNDGEIKYNTAYFAGAGVFVDGGSSTVYNQLIMSGGKITNNTVTKTVTTTPNYGGGGIYAANYARLVISGGLISNNSAVGTSSTGQGLAGGIYLAANSSLTMTGGTISYNTGVAAGGIFAKDAVVSLVSSDIENPISILNDIEKGAGGAGMYLVGAVTATINGVIFDGNNGVGGGGAIVFDGSPSTPFTNPVYISNSTFKNNQSTAGGALYIYNVSANINISNSSFINNTATGYDGAANQSGGAIWYYSLTGTDAYRYLNIANDVVFSGNTAPTRAVPPFNASTTYTNLQFASVSPSFSNSPVNAHILNNYDVNFAGVTNLTLTFNANGGVASSVPSDITYLGPEYTVVIPNQVPTRYGYTFTGWTELQAGTGTKYQTNNNYQLSSATSPTTRTLYAQWTVNTNSVYFNDGFPTTTNVVVPNTMESVAYGSSVNLTSLNPTGTVTINGLEVDVNTPFTFTGWLINVNNADTYDENDPILTLDGITKLPSDSFNMPNGSITLTAQWDPHPYLIKYTNPVDSSVVEVLTPYGGRNVVLPALEAEGQLFLSWNTSPDGTGTSFAPGATIVFGESLGLDNNGNFNLFAIWADNHTVSFDFVIFDDVANAVVFVDETNLPNNLTNKHAGDSVAFPQEPEEQIGFTFVEWQVRSSDDLEDDTIELDVDEEGNFVMPDTDLYFTGVWTRNSNNIYWQARGFDSDAPYCQIFATNCEPQLQLTILFGVLTDNDISHSFFQSNFFDVEHYNVIRLDNGDLKWFSDGIDADDVVINDDDYFEFIMPDNDVTFYVIYEALDDYYIAFEWEFYDEYDVLITDIASFGIDINELNQTIENQAFNSTQDFPIVSETVTGFSFDSWTIYNVINEDRIEIVEEDLNVEDGQFNIQNNLVFIGRFTINSHDISVSFEGDYPDDLVVDDYSISDVPFNSEVIIGLSEDGLELTLGNNTISRNGFIITEVTINEDDINDFEGSFNMPDEDVIISIVWARQQFDVAFSIDGTVDESLTQTIDYNDTATDPMPTKTGHTFSGWFTDSYLSEGNEFDFDTPISEELTLYGVFIINSYDVEFNIDGTVDESLTQTIDYNDTATDPMPTKTGHTFSGWFNDSNLTEGNEFDFETPITEELTLYGVFTINSYDVEFSIDGTVVETLTQTIDYNDIATEPVPTKTGHTFSGWFTDSNLTEGNEFDFETPITEAITLYGEFIPNQVTVTFNVTNGTWSDGSVTTKTVLVSYGQSLTIGQIPTGMIPDVAHSQMTSGTWGTNGPNTTDAITTDLNFTYIFDTLNTYAVTFNIANGTWSNGSASPIVVNVNHGSNLNMSSIPVDMIPNSGYSLSSGTWNVTPNTSTALTSPVTYTFTFLPLDVYIVSFNISGSVDVSLNQSIVSGGLVNRPVDPVQAGYTFNGWFSDAALTIPFDFNTVISGSTTLYGSFIAITNPVNVTFRLFVEGLEDNEFSLTKEIPMGTSVIGNGIQLDLDQFAGLHYRVSEVIFIDDILESHYLLVDDDWTNPNHTLYDDLDEDTEFDAYLLLRRFNVTFVDPNYNLFGDTIQVPFGSNLLEPAIHLAKYDPPANSTHGWYLGVINTRQQAADSVSSATSQMPGNVTNPDTPHLQALAARNLVVKPSGIFVNAQVPTQPQIESITQQSYVLGALDTSNAQRFIFAGNKPEDPNAVHSLSSTIVTSDKVLTRIITMEEQTQQPEQPDQPTTPQPVQTPVTTPATGNLYIVIVVVMLSLFGILLIGRKYLINKK